MECNFFVGQKVIYLGPHPMFKDPNFYTNNKGPKKDEIVTIREVCIAWTRQGFKPCLRLKEYINPIQNYIIGPNKTGLSEVSFRASCFRPLETKGMTILRGLLKTKDESELIKDKVLV